MALQQSINGHKRRLPVVARNNYCWRFCTSA